MLRMIRKVEDFKKFLDGTGRMPTLSIWGNRLELFPIDWSSFQLNGAPKFQLNGTPSNRL